MHRRVLAGQAAHEQLRAAEHRDVDLAKIRQRIGQRRRGLGVKPILLRLAGTEVRRRCDTAIWIMPECKSQSRYMQTAIIGA